MTAFSDIVTDPDNHPIPGVKVYVYTKVGALAFSEPFTTDQFGRFNFDVADGVYRLDYWLGGKKVDSENRIIGNPPEFKGDPGGNVMAIGSFQSASSLSISTGTDRIRTSEWATGSKIGAADYIADPLVDAAFVTAHPRWAFVSANGRGFRLETGPQRVFFEAFGAVGDASAAGVGTDDRPAWLAAKNFIHYFRSASKDTFYKNSIPLHFSRARYLISGSGSIAMELDDAVYQLYGSGGNHQGEGGTVIFIAAGNCGVVAQGWDTTGVTGLKTNGGAFGGDGRTGANGSHLRDLTFISLGGTVGAAQHGVLTRCNIHCERVYAYYFGGHGIAAVASTPNNGNANGLVFMQCGALNNGLSGLFMQGADTNASYSVGFQAFNNREWGIRDESFLNNEHRSIQADGNGLPNTGPPWAPTATRGTVCSYGGHRWRVRPGQHVAASTTTPGTNAAVWIDLGTGTANSFYVAWLSGADYTSGGTVYCGGTNYAVNNNTASVFSGYGETGLGQPNGWGDSNQAITLGGTIAFNFGGVSVYGYANGLASSRIRSRNIHSDGTTIAFQLGGDPSNDGQMFAFGRSAIDEMFWTGHIDADLGWRIRYANSDSYVPFQIMPNSGTTPLAVKMPRGTWIGNVYHTSSNGIPTSGTYPAQARIWNEAVAPGGIPGWIVTTGGAIGSGAVLKAMASIAA